MRRFTITSNIAFKSFSMTRFCSTNFNNSLDKLMIEMDVKLIKMFELNTTNEEDKLLWKKYFETRYAKNYYLEFSLITSDFNMIWKDNKIKYQDEQRKIKAEELLKKSEEKQQIIKKFGIMFMFFIKIICGWLCFFSLIFLFLHNIV